MKIDESYVTKTKNKINTLFNRLFGDPFFCCENDCQAHVWLPGAKILQKAAFTRIVMAIVYRAGECYILAFAKFTKLKMDHKLIL